MSETSCGVLVKRFHQWDIRRIFGNAGDGIIRAKPSAEILLKVLKKGSLKNPEGKQIEAPYAAPEMQEPSQFNNRTKTKPFEIGHED